MVENLVEKKREQEIQVLHKAFESFNEASQQLQGSYDKLQDRINELDSQLADKNLELERNLNEKDKVKNNLNNILESLHNGVVVIDSDEKITAFNQAAGAIMNKSPGKCVGKKLKDVFSSEFIESTFAPLIQTKEKNESLDRVYYPEDNEKIDIRVSASPMKDQKNKEVGTVLIVQDVTHLKRLEEEVHRNQRLTAMGEMAAGIAHEIRNPLGSIELFASLLRKDLEEDVDKQLLADHICSGVKNMDRIISSILLFAKSPEPSCQRCDINTMLEELLEFSSNIIYPENIKIVRKLGNKKLFCRGDTDLLKQVFLNFIRNAIQAMQEDGELVLKSREIGINKKGKKEGACIAISISDTGVGISPENIKKIFNPFFTTKARGTGLGMAIAYNIIKAHQGTIEVESHQNVGTTFTVKIPVWDAKK
jgi:PAS domain S-box-containing protein